MEKFQIKYLIMTAVMAVFLSVNTVEARRGCCSWHGGVCGCDTSVGRQVCCDGQYSPTCTCAYVPPQPKPPAPKYIPPPPSLKPTPKSYPSPTLSPQTLGTTTSKGSEEDTPVWLVWAFVGFLYVMWRAIRLKWPFDSKGE